MASGAAKSDDMTSLNKQKQVNDVMKRLLFDDMDKDGSYFSYFFLEKIFGGTRKCRFCGAFGSGKVSRNEKKLELYVTESTIVGKQEVECVRCGKFDVITSCDDPADVPSDERLRIQGMEVRYYCKKVTHFEVLHDLMELLHIAAIEEPAKRKEKHIEVSGFMMQKAKRVCEEWCKSEYKELRYKKFLRLHEETLINPDHISSHHPDTSEEYKEMYQMMAKSFRDNRAKVASLLELMKESLIDNPTRPSFMLWLGMAMRHVDQYNEFHRLYDHRSFMRAESSIYAVLKERYLSLNVPVGIKKIPVVFLLFELPRFFHYCDFITLRMGKKKPQAFLTDDERIKLAQIDKELKKAGPRKIPIPPRTLRRNMHHCEKSMSYFQEPASDYDLAVRAHEMEKTGPGCNLAPRVVTGREFRSSLVKHLSSHRSPDVPRSKDPPWKDGQKVVLKIETVGYSEYDLTKIMKKLKVSPDVDLDDLRFPHNKPLNLSTDKTVAIRKKQSRVDRDGLYTFDPTLAIKQSPYDSAMATISGKTPLEEEESDFVLRESIPIPSTLPESVDPKVLAAIPSDDEESEDESEFDEDELHTCRAISKIVKAKFDEKNSMFLPTAESAGTAGCITNNVEPGNQEQYLNYLDQCFIVEREGLKEDDFDDMPGDIFDPSRDSEIAVEIPVGGPKGEFSVTPMLFAMDQHGVTIPIMPVIAEGKHKKPEDIPTTTACMKIISALFGLPLGQVTEKQKDIFHNYIEIGMVAIRDPALFNTMNLGAIKGLHTKDKCVVIRCSMADILREAAHEERKQRKFLRELKKRDGKPPPSVSESELKKLEEIERIMAAANDLPLSIVEATEIDEPHPLPATNLDKPIKPATTTADADKPVTVDESKVEDESKVTTDESRVTAVESKAATDESKAATDESKVTAVESKAATDESKATAVESKSATDESKAATNVSKVTADESKIATNESKVTADESKITNESKVVADKSKATTDESKVATDESKIAINESKVTAEESKVTADEPKVATSEPPNKTPTNKKESSVEPKQASASADPIDKTEKALEDKKVDVAAAAAAVEDEDVDDALGSADPEKRRKRRKKNKRKKNGDEVEESLSKPVVTAEGDDKENLSNESPKPDPSDPAKTAIVPPQPASSTLAAKADDTKSVTSEGERRKRARDKFRNCESCGVPIKRIHICSRCRKVAYCNRQCQQNHWKQHKKTCTTSTASKKKMEVEEECTG